MLVVITDTAHWGAVDTQYMLSKHEQLSLSKLYENTQENLNAQSTV